VSRPLFLDSARPADVPDLVALERQSFTHPWSEANFREVVADPSRVSALVLREVRRGGAATLAAYCICQLVTDEFHILDLVVAPDHRRQGLGRWMLEFALERAGRRGAERAFLEVRRSNEAALGLYRELGFRVLAERPDYYRDPGEDALVLEKTGLSGAPGPLPKDP
jgi:[ribosomal protein S18]-alanine N-acetyltransferase